MPAATIRSLRRCSAGRWRCARSRGLGRVEPIGKVLVAYAARTAPPLLDGDGRNSPFTAALLHNIETPGLEITFLFRSVRDDVIEATKREQQPFVYGSLSQGDLSCGTTVFGQSSEHEAGSYWAGGGRYDIAGDAYRRPSIPCWSAPGRSWCRMIGGCRAGSGGSWAMVPTFHVEGRRPTPWHEGTISAMNGHWSIHAKRGLAGYIDGGSYEIRDTTAVITGKFGTGHWKRSLQ